MFKRILAAGAAIVAAGAIATAANIPLLTGPQDPSQLNATINGLIQQINSLITPQSMASYSGPRNYLDNGSMQVQQRGTGTVTCAQNAAITAVAYGADRWGCQANVAVGAGRMAVITASPSPPTDFTASQKLFRTSGALTQPICAWQEIPTTQATELANQTVTVSASLQALAGLSADNGNAANLVVITGTGTDEGFGTPTASPAITPAWTGIATPLNKALTITTSWVRYQASVAIPAAVTEIGVGICFTPTATGAGATDGLAFTGVQLEQGSVASPYEFRPIATETVRAQRYYYQLNDNVANTVPVAMCQATTTSAVVCPIQFPVPMRTAPAAVASAATAFGDTATAGAPTACTGFAVVASSTSILTGKVTCTTGATTTAGGGSQLVGANTSANVNFSADF